MNTPMICATCKRPLKKTKIGVVVEFTAKSRDGGQRPYAKVSGDRYECAHCGYAFIGSYGQAIADFEPAYNKITADIQVPE